MSTDTKNPAEVEDRLWREIEKHHVGMLGTSGSDSLQPMTAFVEMGSRKLWFFTRKSTDLVQEVGGGRDGVFVFQQDDVQACITGRLVEDRDTARIEKFWNPVVAAWQPGGKDDPELTLLCMDPENAEVWVSKSGPARFAWEIARANVTGDEPDVGGRANLNFH